MNQTISKKILLIAVVIGLLSLLFFIWKRPGTVNQAPSDPITYTNKVLEANDSNEPKKFSFAVIGDTQGFSASSSSDSFRSAVKNIVNQNVTVVISVGDLVSSCDGDSKCTKKYDDWKSVAQPILNKTFEVQGNHDRTGRDKADKAWQDEFDLPKNGPDGYSELTYSFNIGNSHFVVLDSEKPQEHVVGQDQRDWLDNDLANNKKPNIFVFYHEPAYPVSSKIGSSLDAKSPDRDALWTIFKKYKVTAIFSGHEHINSRKIIDGVLQFVIGNTNAFDHDLPKPGMADYSYQGHHYAIVSVDNQNVTVNIYKTDGTLLNSFAIPR